jgi:hypothetical protein
MEGNTNLNQVPGQNPEQETGKKSRSKKPLIAAFLVAMLGLGAYGGMQYYNKDNDKTPEVTQEAVVNKEKVEITVNGTDVQINGQKFELAEGQSWQKSLEEFFAKKEMDKTEVIVDFGYADQTVKEEITSALSALKINPTTK